MRPLRPLPVLVLSLALLGGGPLNAQDGPPFPACPEGAGPPNRAAATGLVRDAASHVPLSGALVAVRSGDPTDVAGWAARSDPAGRYLVCGLPVGVASALRAELAGVEGPWVELLPARAETLPQDLTVLPGAPVRPISPTPAPPLADPSRGRAVTEAPGIRLGGIRGQVLEAGTGRPVEEAVVRIGDGRRQHIADREGRFRIQGLAAGTHRLEVRRPGYATLSRDVEVPAGGEVPLTLRLLR